MNKLYKLLLSFNATAWMLIVYCVKESKTLFGLHPHLFDVLLVISVLLTTLLSLVLSKLFGNESIHKCRELSLADNDFLPVYLGYFFVALSVTNNYTMLVVYAIVFVFTFLSQTQYFNPLFLLFGYHYYHVVSEHGTHMFIIKHGKVIRRTEDLELINLRRINDTTYIERR